MMSHGKTTKNYSVSGLQKMLRHGRLVWTGRVRRVSDDPFFDKYADWELNGRAIKHDLGDLIHD